MYFIWLCGQGHKREKEIKLLAEGFATVDWYSLDVAVLGTPCGHTDSCTADTTQQTEYGSL